MRSNVRSPVFTHGLALVAASALALAAGCLRVDQALTLNADGTGRLHVRYGMKQETIRQFEATDPSRSEAGGAPAAKSPFLRFDEKQVREDFKVYAQDGVTLESFRAEEKEGWRYVDLDMRFASLPGLLKTEFLSDRRLTLRRNAEGDYVLEQHPDNPHVPEKHAEDQAAQDMLREVMKGFRATMTVTAPGEVIDSNGTATGRVVSWVFDLEKDPHAMAKAQQLCMRVVFRGAGLQLPAAVGAGPAGK